MLDFPDSHRRCGYSPDRRLQGCGHRHLALDLASTTIAKRLGLSQQLICNYVSDATEPDCEISLWVCCALDTTPNEDLGTDPSRSESDEAELL